MFNVPSYVILVYLTLCFSLKALGATALPDHSIKEVLNVTMPNMFIEKLTTIGGVIA